MEFNIETYIVLDIPSPFAEQVQEIRKRYDPRMATLPIEITVLGHQVSAHSSKSQDSETAFAIRTTDIDKDS